MARVLITGGAGFVGAHCAKALAQAGHEGVVFDSLVRGHREFVKWGPLIVGDIRHPSALSDVFSTGAFDAVLHFAAFAYVGESVQDPSAYYDVNVVGVHRVLEAMRAAGVNKIVFSSSCAVYGQPNSLPINEATPLAPINPYGFSKMACERMLEDFDAAYRIKSVRLRYFNAAGADPEGQIGEEHDPETHLIPLVIDAAMGKGPKLRIFGSDFPTPDGTAVRDYIHVADLADAHVKALGYLLAGKESVTVNLGVGRGYSVREVVDAVERITGLTVPFQDVARRLGDPAALVADPGAAGIVLGWMPVQSEIDQMVRHAWQWRSRHRNANA